jgi:20S proteasome subunit alpha 2
MINANTFLEKRYTNDIMLEDAIHIAILTLKEGFDGQLSENNIELAVIDENKQFKILSPKEVALALESVDH